MTQNGDDLASVLEQCFKQCLNQIFVLDAETLRFLFANARAQHNLGYTLDELREQTLLDVAPSVDPASFERLIEPLRSKARGKVVFETVQRCKDGSEHEVEVHLCTAPDYRGAPALQATVLDVSTRKRTEKELWAFKQVVEHAAIPMVIADLDGRLRHANRAFLQAWGYDDANEVVGRSNADFVADTDKLREQMAMLRRVGQWSGEIVARRKNGAEFAAFLAAAAVPDETGEDPLCLTATFVDQTERNHLQEEFHQAQKMEAVGRLAGGIAHDFNNLLAGIIASCTIASKSLPRGDAARAILEEVIDESMRGAKVARQLLDFSRSRTPRIEPVDVRSVVVRTEDLWQRLVGEDIEVVVTTDASRSLVVADPAYVEQILANLVVNARDAMPGGGRIGVEVVDVTLAGSEASAHELSTGAYVRLSVTDTGCGMAEVTRRQAFEPFFTTKEVGKGTGLGLSSVYGMITSMDGAIDLESEPGKGTTVRIFLPIAGGALGAAESLSEPAEEPETRRCVGRVLVVEDETLVRAGIRLLLTGMNYEVVVASNAKEALDHIRGRASGFDLLLTDVVMPGLSGPELLVEVRRIQPGIRVLFMSGFTGDVLVNQGRLEAGQPVLEKPFTEEQLAEAVRGALGRG